MGVNPDIIRRFLTRRLRNSDKAKRFTDEALAAKIAAMDPVPQFATTPYWHQKITFLLNIKYGQYLDLLDMGIGKTKVALDTFAYRVLCGQSKRMLVLVPNTSNVGGWEDEAKLHAPHLDFCGIDQRISGENRFIAACTAGQIVCMTYQGWLAMICGRKTGKKERGWQIIEKRARAVEKTFDAVVWDEGDVLQNSNTLLFRAMRRLRKSCEMRLLLTGTVMGADPMAVWSQFFLVDGGETFSETLGMFRAAFFAAKPGYFGGMEYKFDQRLHDLFYETMKNRSVRFNEDECLDLPKQVGGFSKPMLRKVEMPPATWKHYEQAVADLKEARGNFKLMKNAYTRLRMLVAGFLPFSDQEGAGHEVVFSNNPKLDALIELMGELPPDKKVVIGHVYRRTGALIAERLKKHKISHVRLYGGTKDKTGVVRQFNDPKGPRVLVASKSAARGHNLQHACHHMVMFESPDGLRDRKQFEKRLRRAGQKHVVYIYDIVMTGGANVDVKILKSLQEGRKLFDLLVEGEENL